MPWGVGMSNVSDTMITIIAWVLVSGIFSAIIYFACRVFLAFIRRFVGSSGVRHSSKRAPENEIASKRIDEQQARIKALSPEEQLAYYYRVIQDLGYDTKISLEDYATAVKEDESPDAIKEVLSKNKKAFSWEKLTDMQDTFLTIQELIPEFTFEYHHDVSGDIPLFKEKDGSSSLRVKGVICGEQVDILLGSMRDRWNDPSAITCPVEFIYDVVNPIISKKFGKQFICLEPNDESVHLVLVDDVRVGTVRANPYFAEEEFWKHFYGYRKTRYTF